MKIARIAAEGCQCWAQSFVCARPKKEVGMSNERTSRLIEAALSGSHRKAPGSAGGYLHKNQIAAEGTDFSLDICVQIGIADYGIDFGEVRDARHAAFGEFA